MKYIVYIAIFIILTGCNTTQSYSNDIAEVNLKPDSCEVSQKIALPSIGKNIFFVEAHCNNDSDIYFHSDTLNKYQFLHNGHIVQFDKKYEERGAESNNEAVSIYESNNHGKLLLSITSWEQCCYPTITGKFYEVDIYEVIEESNGYAIIKIPEDEFGFEDSGLEGNTYQIEGESRYQYKTIAALKEKLKEIRF